MTWEDQSARFLQGYAGRTRERYGAALFEFAAWYRERYGEEPDATLLNSEEVREYCEHLLTRRRLKAASINLRLAALRGLARGVGHELRLRGVRQEKPPVEALNAREVGRLFAVLEGDDFLRRRNIAALALLVRAGLRVGEVVALELGDVTLNERSGWVLVRRGKGRKKRRVPLSAECRRELREYLKVRPGVETLALLVSRSGAPLTARDVQRLVREAARRAGLGRRVTPHTLRHTFATRFLRSGGDLATLALILGHERVVTTTRYLHPDAGRVQEMVEGL